MKRLGFMMLLGTTALIPAPSLAQTSAPGAAQSTVCRDLVAFLEQRGAAQGARAPVALNDARGYMRANDAASCRDGIERLRSAGIQLPANLSAHLAAAPAGTQSQAAAVATPASGQAGGVRPMALSEFEDMDVYTLAGEEIGEVEDVLRGPDGQFYATVAYGGFLGLGERQVLMPLERFALQGDRLIVTGYTIDQLKALPVYRRGTAGYTELEPAARLNVAIYGAAPGAMAASPGAAGGAAGAEIVVQQSAPAVRVEQGAPLVTVQQAQPRVTVRQPNPEIIVRQAPPTITVQQPQPEIIVRMPEPDVNVAMAPPQVQVRQPQPQVQVVQPQQQPQVQVQPAQPQVTMAPSQQQPQVQVQRGQPVVRYERVGEPRVVYQQAEGQPRITYERMAERDAGAADATRAPSGATASAADPNATERRRLYRERFGVLDVNQTAALARPTMRSIRIADLENKDVYNARGEELGEIERVIADPASGVRYAIVEHGGFLGIGEDQVAIPMSRIQLRGNTVVIPGLTEEEIDGMTQWRNRFANYRELNDNMTTEIGVAE